MIVEYWPDDEYHGCCGDLCHQPTIHMHCDSDDEVIDAWLYNQALCVRRDEIGGDLLSPRQNIRYACIIGPGGRVLRRVYTTSPLE